jgi:CheY-like chemotaxis protein
MRNQEHHLNILVIEDNPADLCLIEGMLGSSGIQIAAIYTADRIREAYSILENHPIDLVLLDLSLPDSFGMTLFIRSKRWLSVSP